MTITTINGFVLISNPSDWSVAPSAKRVWETEIAEALHGDETRQALRSLSRRQVTFNVTATCLPSRSRLDARIDAAKLSGLACAPLHGRMSPLAQNANAGSNVLTLLCANWNWQAGDYAILIADDQTFDVQQVTGIDGLTLSLAGNLANTWPALSKCWPVLFGTLTSEKMDVLDGWHGSIKITIAELSSPRSTQLGVVPIPPPGVGQQAIGKTNQI
jgi:hypothetical protein